MHSQTIDCCKRQEKELSMNSKLRSALKRMAYKGKLDFLSDKKYLELLFLAHLDRKLDWENLKTFNEKVQWLKLHNHKEEYTMMADKYAVKEYIASIIGEEYIIPTLGVWNHFDEIDFDILPDQFVLKCTHDSGGLAICTDKALFDKDKAREKIEKSLKRNYFRSSREWQYKDIQPRIIAEPFIGNDNKAPEDYKFITFNGELDTVMVCKGRDVGHPWFYFYNREWKRVIYQHPELEKNDEVEKPENFDVMLKIVDCLAQGFIHMRVDLYNVAGRVYFGELTFFNQSGFDTDITYETDLNWGNKMKVPF